jgi:hypothetical protein
VMDGTWEIDSTSPRHSATLARARDNGVRLTAPSVCQAWGSTRE